MQPQPSFLSPWCNQHRRPASTSTSCTNQSPQYASTPFMDGRFEPIPFQIDERDQRNRWALDQGPQPKLDDSPGVFDENDVLVADASRPRPRGSLAQLPKEGIVVDRGSCSVLTRPLWVSPTLASSPKHRPSLYLTPRILVTTPSRQGRYRSLQSCLRRSTLPFFSRFCRSHG